jgi:predicted MFS family arabinose efflux permease
MPQLRSPASLDALAHRDFRVWLIGFFLSAAGGAMDKFGIGWLVVLIASAKGAPASLYLGLLGLVGLVPALILGPIAGVVIDRVDRRLLLMLSQGASGVLLVLLGLAASTGIVEFWMVLGAAGMFTIASVLYIPTRQAIQPRLVGERDLSSAIGVNSITMSLSWLLGPLLGGILIRPLGVGGVLVVGGVAQLLGTAAFAFLPPLRVIADGEHAGTLRSVLDGLRYVRSQALLFWLFIAYAASMLFLYPYLNLLPALARDVLLIGPVQLSWLYVADNIGGLAGGIVIASTRRLTRFPIVMVGALMIAGLLIGMFVRQRDIVPLLLIMAVLGFAEAMVNGSISLFVQTTTPDHLRGRVNSLLNLLIEVGMTTGTLVVGVLATAVGVDHALTLGGLALVIVCLVVAWRPAVARPRTSSG